MITYEVLLFNVKAKLSLLWFYDVSIIVSYLMPNPLYTYVLDIYDLVWLGFMTYQPL